MAIEVFNRYENKYLVSASVIEKLQSRLSDYMEIDAYSKKYGTYNISNLYYDTEDNYLIRTSLSKPKYKEKLRFRAYGVPCEDSTVYVEIKKKVAGLVNKRRSAMTLLDAYDLLAGGAIKTGNNADCMNTQVIREIEYLLSVHNLKPALYISYDRRAYFGAGQQDIRVSFDTNILTRRTDLRLEAGCFGESLLQNGTWLMEVKVKDSIPIWLSRLLSEYKLYPTSFSKYGSEYRKTIMAQRETKTYIYTPTPTSVSASSNAMVPLYC